MAKLQDKFYNRVIEGNLTDISDADAEEIGKKISGGTQLYRHTIEDDNGTHMVIINNSSTPIDTSDTNGFMNTALSDNVVALKCQEASDTALFNITYLIKDENNLTVRIGNTTLTTFFSPFSDDTVTPL